MMNLFIAIFAASWVFGTSDDISYSPDRLKHRNSMIFPENLIIGYANWMQCDEKLVTAVEDGVNVLIWFSINLSVNESTGTPLVTGGPDLRCVQRIKDTIASKGLPTIHLISIGGWNSPHPDTSNSAESIYENWRLWNNDLFDGFDWDIEGSNNLRFIYFFNI